MPTMIPMTNHRIFSVCLSSWNVCISHIPIYWGGNWNSSRHPVKAHLTIQLEFVEIFYLNIEKFEENILERLHNFVLRVI